MIDDDERRARLAKRVRDGRQTYDRLKMETDAAYARFQAYLRLPPELRSVRRIAGQVGVHETLLGRQRSNNFWRERAADWDFERERAQLESDAAAQQARADAQVAEADEMHDRQAQAGRAATALGLLHLTRTLDAANKADDGVKVPGQVSSLSEALRLIEVGSKVERLARGEATSVVDNRVADQFVTRLLQVALRYVPEEAHEAFLQDIQRAAGLPV